MNPALDGKEWNTILAKSALRGVAVEHVDGDAGGDEYYVSQGALTRRCASLDELLGLLRRMGIDA